MTTPEDTGSPRWVTLAEAAALLDQSQKTVRRKIKAGELVAEMRHDPEIGSKRWFVDAHQLPRPPGTALPVPIEVVERIEALHREIAAAGARAEKAEIIAEFERERRKILEDDIQAATDAAEVARIELEALMARRWWQRRQK